MILAQLGIPAQDAFVRLRAYAFAQRRPLGDVARTWSPAGWCSPRTWRSSADARQDRRLQV